jgi:PAS domain S-box-containing protein
VSTHPSETGGGPRSLLDVLRVGIVMLDARGEVILWSPVTEEILGWPEAEAVGRHLTDFVPAGHEGPGTRIYRALLRERYWRGTLPLRHRNGHTVELEGRASLLWDREGTPFILANLVEISRMRAIEQDLAALDALFTASPLGIAIFDTERRFVRVNDALSRLHGTPADDLLGRTVMEILPPPLSQQIYELQQEVLRSGRPVIDLITTAPDGSGARSVSFGRLTDRAGRTLGVSCTVIDVTERRDALANVERARRDLTLLDDVGIALGNLLDVDRVAESLAQLLVPRYADYVSVTLLRPVVRGGELPGPAALADETLIRLAVGVKQHSPVVDQLMRQGQELPIDPANVIGAATLGGAPRLFTSEEEIQATAPGDVKASAARALGIHSMITAPLPARGTVLGLLTLTRAGRRTAFDGQDLALATEVAARAGISLDNARLYARERERAVMLQRSLLPSSVPELPGVSVSYRYVPSGVGSEVGGDWFDVMPLAGGRVAFVIGDVTGHDLTAAAIMGRLRTAVRTLAGLDLAPAELLRRVNEMSEDIAQHPDDPLMATCLYAVYDPAARVCTLAKAGHLPPLLFGPEPGPGSGSGRWAARALDLPSGAPLGVTGVPFEERRIEVARDAVLVLYTDGLIETRGEDIGEGMERLCRLVTRTTRPGAPLEPLCDAAIGELSPPGRAGAGPEDDIVLLAARLAGLPDDAA